MALVSKMHQSEQEKLVLHIAPSCFSREWKVKLKGFSSYYILPQLSLWSNCSQQKKDNKRRFGYLQNLIVQYLDLNKSQSMVYCAGPRCLFYIVCFFSIWVFFHEHLRFTGQQGKGEGIYLTRLYHTQPVHSNLNISRAISAERLPLHTGSTRTRTGNLLFFSASC